MTNYLTIDGGTTNTRIALVRENKTVDVRRLQVGAKDGIGNKTVLKQAIKQGIAELLAQNNLRESEIKRILASGMITSELGLVNLPHIAAPAGLSRLHGGIYETVIKEVSSIPFAFVQGVKIQSDRPEQSDMMRGEETELMGLFRGEGLYVLPGSHSKIIAVDGEQNIVGFQTMLTGEMIAALSQNTILKDAVSLDNTATDPDFLRKGYEFCKENGLNQALFKVRVLSKLFDAVAAQTYSFFMGAVLCGEVEQIVGQEPKCIFLAGREQIKNALAILLQNACKATVEIIGDEEAEQAVRKGVVKIYEYGDGGEK